MEEEKKDKLNFKIVFLLIAILAIGFFLRIYNIGNTPPGVYPDEAVNGMDAIQANESGHYQWFYTANNGREGLFMNMIAMSFKLFGISPVSLRIPSIVFGTLTILGTYLVAKELFQKERVGLLAGYLVAVSYWSINFSRISFRAIMVPFILSFSLYFLLKAVRTKRWYNFAAGGLIFGIGLHTYIAFRIAPLILVVALMSFVLSRKDFLKEYWKGILIFILGTVVTVSPMLYTFYLHPEYLSSRTASVSILSPEVNQGHLVATFLRSFGLSLAKYNFWGDQNWRHNYPPYPILDIASGIAFLFGIVYSFIRLFHLLWNRIVNGYRDSRLDKHVLLISWFFIMLAPEFMSAEGLPHALRSIGTLPVVFIFAAMTFDYLFRYAEKHTDFFKRLNAAIVIAVLLSIGIFNGVKYLVFWAHQTEAASAFERPLIDVSEYLHTLPLQQEKIVFAESMQRIPIQVFDWKMPNTEYVYSGQIGEFSPKSDNFIVILTDKNAEVINHIQNKFPDLTLRERKDVYGLSFYTLSK